MNFFTDILRFSRLGRHVTVAGLLFLVSLSAHAGALNLNLLTPKIAANFSTATYTGSLLSVTGNGALTVEFPSGSQNNVTAGNLIISATMVAGTNDTTNPATISTGTITVTGSVTLDGTLYNSGTLLTGTLVEIGYDNTSPNLEFIFNPTGGDLAQFYTVGSGQGGIILELAGYNGGNFASDFASNPFGAIVKVAPVPVPAAVWLFGSALLGLTGIARRSNKTV